MTMAMGSRNPLTVPGIHSMDLELTDVEKSGVNKNIDVLSTRHSNPIHKKCLTSSVSAGELWMLARQSETGKGRLKL